MPVKQIDAGIKTDAEVWAALREPIPGDVVNKRAATRGGPLVIPYVNVGIVEDRLDNVLTPAGWNVEFALLTEYLPKLVMECALTLTLPSGLTVTKVEVGEASGEDEAIKALYSDSLKRAARRFGIGRELGIKNSREETDEAPPSGRRESQRSDPRLKAPAREGGATNRQPEAVKGRVNEEKIEHVGALLTWAQRKHGIDRNGVLEILGGDGPPVALEAMQGLKPERYAEAARTIAAHFDSQQPPDPAHSQQPEEEAEQPTLEELAVELGAQRLADDEEVIG